MNMEVDVTSIEAVAQNPADAAVTLTTNVTWILTCPDWVTPSATFGNGDAILTFAIATNYKDEKTNTQPRSGEIRISGGGTLTGKGAVVTIPVTQEGYTYVDPNPSLGGIPDAEEFAEFIVAANSGGSLTRWTSENNEVVLLADINLADVEIDWQAIADAATVKNANNGCTISGPAFTSVFNGDGKKITGFNPVVKLAEGTTFGLFAILNGGTVKNVELSGTLNVSAEGTADAGMLVGTAYNSTIQNVTINGKVVSTGTTASKRYALGGVCGFAFAQEGPNTLIENAVVNVEAEAVGGTNTGNGATCAMYGGVVGFATSINSADNVSRVVVQNCVNNGNMNVTLGRCSGICATMNTGTNLIDCTNNGDQVNKIANGRLGNIVCNMSHYCQLINCVNNGDLDATVDGYSGTVGGIFALAGSANGTKIEGGGNYGTIKTLSSAGNKYVGLLWANHNADIPTSGLVASGRIIVDGVERTINEGNYMDNVGSIKVESCVTGITWVAPK